jgi:WD40 repeat protein
MMTERRKFIKDCIQEFIPTVLLNLVIDYDFYLIGKCDLTLEENMDWINCCIVLPDGPSKCFDERIERIICGSNSSLKIWNVTQDKKCESRKILDWSERFSHINKSYHFYSNYITCCAILSDEFGNYRLVSGGYDGIIRIWKIENANENIAICEFESEEQFSYMNHCAVLSNDRIVCGSYNGMLKIWNIKTKKYELTFKDYCSFGKCVVLPDSSHRIVCGDNNGNLKILNAHNGECEMVVEGHSKWINCFAILPDNNAARSFRIISGSEDTTLKIWKFEHTIKCECTLRGHTGGVKCCTVLPDGRIVSGSEDGTLKVWNIETGTSSRRAHSSGQRNNCWSSKGQEGKCDLTLKGHASSVVCCSVLSDGRIISGSRDNTLKIWN